MDVVKYDIDNADEQYGMNIDNRNEHYGMDVDNRNEHYGMDNMEARVPHAFMEQQTFNGNPTKEERQPTDTPFITMYSIILFIWIYTIITVINYETIPLEHLNLTREIDLLTIERIDPRFTWKFPLCTSISGLIAVAYIYFLTQSIGRIIIYIGLAGIICLMILLIIVVFLISFSLFFIGGFAFLLIIIIFATLLLALAYLLVCCWSVRNVGTDAIFEIIRDACCALTCCPSIAIFSCAMSAIIILIITFMIYITKVIILSNCDDGIFRFYVIVNVYCAVALTNFFTNLTQIVISGYVIDWYWSKDINLLSLSIKRSLDRILSYHMGTVAFFSIPLLPHICSICHLCRNRNSDSNVVKKYDFPTRFFGQLRAFMNIVDFGMIQTSIYGYESTTAIKAVHDLVSQNNHEINLAVCQISDVAVGIGSYLISIPFHVEHVNTSLYSLVIPFYIVLATAVRTLLVNKMKNNCISENFQDESHNVPPQYGTIMTE